MDEPIMYVVVNDDLRMGKGKIAAQVGHACIGAYQHMVGGQHALLDEWMTHSHAKVVLRASEAVLRALIQQYADRCVTVYDEGRTQIDAGSLTVVAFDVMRRSEQLVELKSCKLL
jgi:PTH2 family peptidyl-tRNA hydrolase